MSQNIYAEALEKSTLRHEKPLPPPSRIIQEHSGRLVNHQEHEDYKKYSKRWNDENRPYKDGTSRNYIINDGWMRGFGLSQTMSELVAMGHQPILEEDLEFMWKLLTENMQLDFELDNIRYMNDT